MSVPRNVFLLGLLFGCEADPFDSFVVEDAWIEADGSTHGMFAFVGGYGLEDADLFVTQSGGYTWRVPIELSGSVWGIGADIGTTVLFEPEFKLNAYERSLSEVLGDYSGSVVAFDAMIGFANVDVKNEAGCEFSMVGINLGLGFLTGGALLNMRATDDPYEVR